MEPTLYNGSLSDSLGPLINSFKTASIYGDETKFPELKQKAISEISDLISEMKNTGNPENFKTVLARTGQLRKEMAFATESADAEQYGDERISGDYMSTLLSTEKYKVANTKIKELVLDSLKLMPDKTKTRRKTIDNSRYTFKLLKENDLLFVSPFATFTKMMTGKHNEADESMFAMSHLIDHKEKTLPLLNLLEGKNISKADIIKDQNLYVFLGRIELKTNNEWRTLTRHVTVLKCDNNGEIDIENFKLHGIVALLHTSYKDFIFHTVPMASLFNQILNSPSENLNTLMREFEYRLHHICYFPRGSATCSEIILEALKSVIHPQYILIGNLETLAEPFLSSYIKL